MFDVFVKDLEKDLRRVSNQSFLFEEINPSYEREMINLFNKFTRDELETSINYKIMSESIVGEGANAIKKELQEHAYDEYQHFNKLIEYASNHGILQHLEFEVRKTFTTPEALPTDVKGIVEFTQSLEKEAAKDYKEAAELADEEGDTETKLFFEELMKEELKHYDDISNLHKSQYGRAFNDI
ncbi:MAG: ferritin-like domain-containing protein [Clostridiales bacterium]|nr:ferritin-like domain-containing protein [Clostridiales bacterium]